MAARVEAILSEASGRNYLLHAWVIMPNHIHLVLEVWEVPLAKLVKKSLEGEVCA